MSKRNWVLLTMANDLTIHRFATRKAAEEAQDLIRAAGGKTARGDDAISVFVIDDGMSDEEEVTDDLQRRRARHAQG
jgi:hypothetical protein